MKFNIRYNGEKIRQLLKRDKLSIVKFSKQIGVSRPTVYSWIAKPPKGYHVILICKFFDVGPEFFFETITDIKT